MSFAAVGKREVKGFEALTLVAADAGVEVAFVPEAGMVGCSLRHRDEELLGQRGGLLEYVADRSTMGIPLLHPWANRLGVGRFSLAGREVDLASGPVLPSLDPNGLPIHGLMAAARGWRVERHDAEGDEAHLAARFDFAADEDMLAAFPFPHAVALAATLRGGTLTIATTVAATGDVPVPIAFGFHPYLRLPGVERSAWRIEVPVRERLRLDRRMLPTGERDPVAIETGALGTRTFDDAYLAPEGPRPFVLAGGGRRIEVSFGAGYPYAQVYAPADDDVVAFEPMTSPTNALLSGDDLTVLEPGESYEAVFEIAVGDEG